VSTTTCDEPASFDVSVILPSEPSVASTR
jgi:hypothetical protein